MDTQSRVFRSGLFLCHATLWLAVAGCTITARTPIEEPAETKPTASTTEPPSAPSHTDDGWKPPKAERVQDAQPAGASTPPSSHHQKTIGKQFELGHAQVEIGERPPWLGLKGETPSPLAGRNSQVTGTWGAWKLKKTIWVGKGYLHQAAFTANQESIVTLSTESGEFYHYDLKGKLLHKIALPHFEEFEHTEFAVLREAVARTQLVITRDSGTSVLDLESGRFDRFDTDFVANSISHTGQFGLYGLSFFRIAPQSGSLLLQWITGDIAAKLVMDNRPDDWALSRDGTNLAIQYYPSNTVEVLDLKSSKLVATLSSPKWGGTVALSPTGSLIALGGEKLVIARLPGGEIIAEDTKYGNNIDKIKFSQDGSTLLVSAYDGKARSYTLPKDLSQMTELGRPQYLAHNGSANVYALGLSENEEQLVTSSGDKTLKLWTRKRSGTP